MKVIAVAALAASLLAGAMPAAAQKNPLARQRADELFAADQALGAASAKSDGLAGLSAALADDVTVPLPGQGCAARIAESSHVSSSTTSPHARNRAIALSLYFSATTIFGDELLMNVPFFNRPTRGSTPDHAHGACYCGNIPRWSTPVNVLESC